MTTLTTKAENWVDDEVTYKVIDDNTMQMYGYTFTKYEEYDSEYGGIIKVDMDGQHFCTIYANFGKRFEAVDIVERTGKTWQEATAKLAANLV